MNKKYLLLGGAGFIGSNIAKTLVSKGERVLILDKNISKLKLENIESRVFDFYSAEKFDEILKDVKTVIFLICNVGPQSSMTNSFESYGGNIGRLIELLDAMRRNDINQLIFISSGGTIYGEKEPCPVKETDQTNPINHYGILKLTQEKILLMYNNDFKMKNIIFRVANPYGIGQDVRSGIGAVTAFIRNIQNGEYVKLYGNGKDIIRDYIYIDDVCNIIYKAIEIENKLDNSYQNCIYNVGTGVGSSIFDVLITVQEVLNKKAKVEYLAERIGDVKYNVLDTKKIQKLLGGYSCLSLKEGIKSYVRMLEGE